MDQGNAAVQSPGEAPPANPDRWWTLAAVECGNFVVYMDGFIVTLAMPAMARQFGVGLPVLKWVVVAYLHTVTVTLLPAGRLADIWGRRRIVVIGMGVLVVTSVLCALAPTVETLIAFRVLQGVGGGLFHPPNNSATLNTVPAQHLSVANGFLSMARNFGQAIGAALAASLLAHGLGAAGRGRAGGPSGGPAAGVSPGDHPRPGGSTDLR